MRRRKHEISSVDGALDLTSVPVTKKDLKDEWNARKHSGAKRIFVSFLKEDIEYIYAFRFLKEDIEKDRPVVQLAFIRTREDVYSNREMNSCYLCGYIMKFRGCLCDFHQPKSRQFDLQFAIPTIMQKHYESDKVQHRPRPTCSMSLNAKKYGLRKIEKLKYIPDEGIEIMEMDPTYYMSYIMKNSETVYIAEILTKLGHPECLRNRSWFNLSKKELVEMVRYAQKAKMEAWEYNTIKWNLTRISPEKALKRDVIKKFGEVRRNIPWAKTIGGQKEVLAYLDKQDSDLDTYADYFSMRNELGLDSESHSARFPSNLIIAHDRLVKDCLALREQKLEEAEKDENMKLMAICGNVHIESDRYVPEIPKSKADLRYYGKLMDNCLGNSYWASDIIKKVCFIFLLGTKVEETDTPVLACEVRRAKKRLVIKQLYMKHNEVPDDDTRRYVNTKILPQLENQVLL